MLRKHYLHSWAALSTPLRCPDNVHNGGMAYDQESMKRLAERRRRYVLFLRKRGVTFASIADEFGCSRQRVHAIWKQAVAGKRGK